MAVPTPHISAKLGDFAKTVLMPGDPLRAEFIAKNYLENAVLVNNVRGVQGYTGYYKGKRVSVMASGMGQPSIGIYSYELFNFYGVETIIRVGSCGSFSSDLHVRDIVVAMGACTNGNYASQYNLSSDMFYDDANSGMQWAKMGVLGVEMESAALYCNAARAGKKALCICTVSDSFIYPEENTTAEERQNSFTKMMEIALNIAD